MVFRQLSNRVVRLFLGLLWAAGYCCLFDPGTIAKAELPVPALESITRVDRTTRPSQVEMESSAFILKTHAHSVLGDAYVIVTDHTDDAYLRPLDQLAQHHAGTILRVDDLGKLHAQQQAREELKTALRKAKPRFVAVAPRLQSYHENMLLAMWDVLSTLDRDGQLAVFPGLLVAPNAPALATLVEHSIHYQPQSGDALRPFVIGQVVDDSVTGQRSLQKVGIIRNLFEHYGHETPALVTRGFRARSADGSQLNNKQQWEVSAAGPRQFIPSLPPQAKRAIDDASLLLMFGHGVPGMTCTLDVAAFHNVTMTNKVVMCGSCFSAYPPASTFPPMPSGPDGSAIQAVQERFVMRAVENGAVVVSGHMRMNSGFPHLYPLLEAWLNGLTVGEAYQRLMNTIIDMQGLAADDLMLREGPAAGQGAVLRRNPLLCVVIGDPALQPLVRMK